MPRVKNDGFGNQRLSFKHGRPARKLKKGLVKKIRAALQPKCTQLLVDSHYLHPGSGVKDMVCIPFCDITDMTTLINNINSGSTSEVADLLVNKNGRLQVTDYTGDIKLVNQGTGVASLRVYECICRRDFMDQGSGNSWNTNLQNGFNAQEQGSTAPNGIKYTSFGGTLFQNPWWVTYARVLKVVDLQVASGATVQLNVSHMKSYTVNPIIWNTFGNVLGIGGCTRMFVIESIGKVGDGGASDFINITTGVGKIDMIRSCRIHYTLQPITSSYTYLNGTLPNNTLGTTTYMQDNHSGVYVTDAPLA